MNHKMNSSVRKIIKIWHLQQGMVQRIEKNTGTGTQIAQGRVIMLVTFPQYTGISHFAISLRKTLRRSLFLQVNNIPHLLCYPMH